MNSLAPRVVTPRLVRSATRVPASEQHSALCARILRTLAAPRARQTRAVIVLSQWPTTPQSSPQYDTTLTYIPHTVERWYSTTPDFETQAVSSLPADSTSSGPGRWLEPFLPQFTPTPVGAEANLRRARRYAAHLLGSGLKRLEAAMIPSDSIRATIRDRRFANLSSGGSASMLSEGATRLTPNDGSESFNTTV